MPADLDYKFMRQGPDFVLGFEAGQFWERAEQCPAGKTFEFFYHVENEGEILRMATHFGVIRNDWHTEDRGQCHRATFFR